MKHVYTFRNASFTLSSVIRPFFHNWFTRSSLDVPELLHAIVLFQKPLAAAVATV